jgi:hypothetical protein
MSARTIRLRTTLLVFPGGRHDHRVLDELSAGNHDRITRVQQTIPATGENRLRIGYRVCQHFQAVRIAPEGMTYIVILGIAAIPRPFSTERQLALAAASPDSFCLWER